MNDEPRPSQRTAQRAASIWKRLLQCPNYDAGLTGVENVLFQGLMATTERVTDEQLNAFERELISIILTPTNEAGDFFDNVDLYVDYDPCCGLQLAAERAGIGISVKFPVKVSMHVYSSFVSVKGGYGAAWMNHYALDNGKWLVTTLTGSNDDVSMIRAWAENNVPPIFQVED